MALAHKRAKERLEVNDPYTVLPDDTFHKDKTLELGDTRELARIRKQFAVRAAPLLRALGRGT